jgi:deoxyribodipyrimidine photolyase
MAVEKLILPRNYWIDMSANVGNWQWAAGTGCDAAPYFRVFNPEISKRNLIKRNLYQAMDKRI